MQTIGLIGGLSWQSSAEYYRIINETVAAELGGLHSAKIVLHSVDFQPVEDLQRAGDWDEIARQMADAAKGLECAGADFFLFCTNTTHRVAPQVADAVGIPLLHIAEAAGEAIRANSATRRPSRVQGPRSAVRGLPNPDSGDPGPGTADLGPGPSAPERVGLLGSCYTMEQDFYRGYLLDNFGIRVDVPGAADRRRVDEIIYKELSVGERRDESRDDLLRIISELAAAGAEGVVLGCTELPLLVGPAHTEIPLFDTMRIHAEAAAHRSIMGL